jgi:hypothetical protein
VRSELPSKAMEGFIAGRTLTESGVRITYGPHTQTSGRWQIDTTKVCERTWFPARWRTLVFDDMETRALACGEEGYSGDDGELGLSGSKGLEGRFGSDGDRRWKQIRGFEGFLPLPDFITSERRE